MAVSGLVLLSMEPELVLCASVKAATDRSEAGELALWQRLGSGSGWQEASYSWTDKYFKFADPGP